jgi:hypothetical protein
MRTRTEPTDSRGGRRVATSALLALTLLSGALLGSPGCGCGGDSDLLATGELSVCPVIDLVFVMDTSGSMDDEAQALCDAIALVRNDIESQGGVVGQVALIGIIEPTPPDTLDDFPCLTDNVANLLGTDVPGTPPACCPILGGDEGDEDWGSATAIVAARFPWTPGALRIIVPISDEGPEEGDPCEDPGPDREAIDNAIAVSVANDVTVSPIIGTDADACVISQGALLAAGTGGVSALSTDPDADLAGFIVNLVRQACGLEPLPPQTE